MTGKILLTGATGFVGRQVMRAIKASGRSARVVIRKGSAGPLESMDGLELVETADLFAEDVAWWAQACREIDTVIHTAWYAVPGKYLQAPENLACLTGTLALAKASIQTRVRRFVGIGTCFEYEMSGGTLSVETPLRPTTVYAGTKAAAFLVLSNWFLSQRVEFAWCRLFYLYGDGEPKGRLVSYLRGQLAAGEPAELTSGTQVRDYLDVREAGRLIAEVALGKRQGAINICSGLPVTVRQLAEQIADEYGRRDLLLFGHKPDNLTDPPHVLGEKEIVAP